MNVTPTMTQMKMKPCKTLTLNGILICSQIRAIIVCITWMQCAGKLIYAKCSSSDWCVCAPRIDSHQMNDGNGEFNEIENSLFEWNGIRIQHFRRDTKVVHVRKFWLHFPLFVGSSCNEQWAINWCDTAGLRFQLHNFEIYKILWNWATCVCAVRVLCRCSGLHVCA